MQLREHTLKAMNKLLGEECSLHEQYIAIIEAERGALRKLDLRAIKEETLRRDRLIKEMTIIKERREALTLELAKGENLKLSEVLVHCTDPVLRKEIQKKIDALKSLVKRSGQGSKDFGQLLNFSLNVVNSTLSLILSGTQDVSRSYGKTGVIKEKFISNPSSPSGSRRV